MFDESDCLKTSTCQYSVIVVAVSLAYTNDFPDCGKIVEFCDRLFLLVRVNRVLWAVALARPPPIFLQLALPFLLHMRNIKWQTKQKHNKIPLFIWAAQRGPFTSSDSDTNKLVRAQNSITQEPKLILWHCYYTVLRDPVRSVWIHRRMNKDWCWEAFIFCSEICYKQIKRHWCRKPEAVTLTVTMVLWQK